MKSVLVIGGAGYVGSVLSPKLLDKGYKVTVFDIMYYGDKGLPKNNPNLKIVKGDMCNLNELTPHMKECDAIIHLACISNDPSFELDPGLSKRINFDSFEPLVKAAKENGVKRFIYASTSSVYGVSDAPQVTEDHPLVPLTDYNKYKGLSEPYLLKYQSPDFTTVIIRPATVCGYSPRTRLDLTVNILTNHAYNNRLINVFGGGQKRPNIHVEDISDLYVELLTMPKEKIAGETFNAGYQNFTVMELAQFVKKIVEREFPEKAPIDIKVVPTDDNRSYHVNSDKIKNKLGWSPKRNIEDAVMGLCQAFKAGKLPDSLKDPQYFNIATMKNTKA